MVSTWLGRLFSHLLARGETLQLIRAQQNVLIASYLLRESSIFI